jgi:hypothetical protein
MKKIIVLLTLITLPFAIKTYAVELPEPIIYLPFDVDWANAGSAGYEEPAVTEKNGLEPQLNYKGGIIGGCLDQSGFPASGHPVLDENLQPGQVIFGTSDDQDSPMELAMDDMVSFTIVGWFKGKIGSGSGARLIARPEDEANPESNCFQLLADRYYSGKMELIVNGNSSTQMQESFYDNSPNEWMFFAVTYDGTSSFNHVQWFKGYDDGTNEVIQSSGFCSLYSGTSTHGKHSRIHIGNSGDSGAWPFSGMLDEIRVYASYTDTSGVLSLEQLETIKSLANEPRCGDAEHPYPPGDFNGDCVVGVEDLRILCDNWLNDTNFYLTE